MVVIQCPDDILKFLRFVSLRLLTSLDSCTLTIRHKRNIDDASRKLSLIIYYNDWNASTRGECINLHCYVLNYCLVDVGIAYIYVNAYIFVANFLNYGHYLDMSVTFSLCSLTTFRSDYVYFM